jgi:hypothetical protein
MQNRFFRVPIFKIEGANTIGLRRIYCRSYALDVDQDTMQRIVKELGGEKVMPSFAEKLMSKGEIKGKQELLVKLLRRKFGLSFSYEKTIRSVTDESKLDAAAEAVLDAMSKDEVFKILRSTDV